MAKVRAQVASFIERARWQWGRYRRRRAASANAVETSDLAIVGGFGLLVTGLWMVAAPLALIVAGVLLLTAGLMRSW